MNTKVLVDFVFLLILCRTDYDIHEIDKGASPFILLATTAS